MGELDFEPSDWSEDSLIMDLEIKGEKKKRSEFRAILRDNSSSSASLSSKEERQLVQERVDSDEENAELKLTKTSLKDSVLEG